MQILRRYWKLPHDHRRGQRKAVGRVGPIGRSTERHADLPLRQPAGGAERWISSALNL